MIPILTKALAIQKFDLAIEKKDKELIIDAWQMQYFSRLLSGIDFLVYKPDPNDPDSPPGWPRPWPWPPWPFRIDERYGGVLSLIDVGNAPNQQIDPIFDNELKMKAAQNVIKQLKDGIASLEKELNS